MSVDQREVQEVYRKLLDAIVSYRWAVSPADKDVIDGYWEKVFKFTEGLTLNGSSLQIFQGQVRSAIPELEQMQIHIGGGVIHNNDAARVLSDLIEKALGVSSRFLQIQPPR